MGVGGQQLQVGSVSARQVGIGVKLIVEFAERCGGKERPAVLVLGERAGLACHGGDEMTPVHAVIVAVRADRDTNGGVAEEQFDLFQRDQAAQSFADVRGRHRVVMAIDGDQAAGIYTPGELNRVGKTAWRDGVQITLLLFPCRHAGRIASVQHPMQEPHVLPFGVEVSAAPEPQCHVQLSKKMAVCAFHRTVLVRAADIDRTRLQSIVVQQTSEGRVERPLLALADSVGHAAAVVHLQPVGYTAGAIQGLAQRRL